MPDLGEVRSRIVGFFKKAPYVWDLVFVTVLLVACACAVASWNCYTKPGFLFNEPLSHSDFIKATELLKERGVEFATLDGGYIVIGNPHFSRNLRKEMIRLGITPDSGSYHTFDYRNASEGGE